MAESPKTSWYDLAPVILRRSPSTAIILLSDRDDNDYASTALRLGISAFLLKDADWDKLAHIVNVVFLGGLYITASVSRRALERSVFTKRLPKNSLPFSSVERGIVAHIAQGFSDEEIAEHLNYSPGTVKNCLTAIKRKTKLKNRVQIVIYSLIYGLIGIDQLEF